MLQDIKEMLEKQGQTWNAFQHKNDARLAALEASKVTADYDAQLAQMNDAITQMAAQIKAAQTRAHRITGTTDASDSEYKTDFLQFIRKGETAAIETKAINVGVGTDGGMAVPEEFDRHILQLLRNLSPMRQVSNVITVGSEDYKKLVNIGTAESGWVGETDARPDTSTPKLAPIALFFGEIYANPAATQKSLDDIYFNVEQWINSEVSDQFSAQEGKAFLFGDGIKKPRGLLANPHTAAADAKRPFGTLQSVVSGLAGAIHGDSLIDLIHAAKAGYRSDGKFMMNNLSLAAIRKLKDGDGHYLWRAGLEVGAASSLLGYPIVENEDLPDIATDAIPVLFGDFKRAYTIADRMGVRMLRDPYTNKPYVQFYTTKRVGGALMDSQAVKLLKISS